MPEPTTPIELAARAMPALQPSGLAPFGSAGTAVGRSDTSMAGARGWDTADAGRGPGLPVEGALWSPHAAEVRPALSTMRDRIVAGVVDARAIPTPAARPASSARAAADFHRGQLVARALRVPPQVTLPTASRFVDPAIVARATQLSTPRLTPERLAAMQAAGANAPLRLAA